MELTINKLWMNKKFTLVKTAITTVINYERGVKRPLGSKCNNN